ncbi:MULTISPECIES: response regulator [Caldimonas]|jgi:two-component system response regulator TctD|uniref:response regulator n=1 Tax=Caldimonas TaxID=196013 RepID=UPI000366BAF2|nr:MULTISPECIES: response regulator [Caldimonas]MCX7660617.1 response regulator [Caldimonas manganoxidans]GIX24365.1 MAG: DNA-binding response regulator [Caldimonas sp.]
MRILLVEDEPELARWLAKTLAQHAGIVVDWAHDGVLADRRLSTESFDAVVLDLGLPGLDGRGVIARMRERDDRTPVLVLTARDSLAERVGTLHEGADDFLPKPFMVEELEARLLALVRRARGKEHPRLACGPLHFDAASQRFTVGAEVLPLSPREHAVLRALIQKSGEPLSKQHILDRVFADEADVNLEAIEVYVHRLRKKLAGTGVHIVTLRGLGYCLEADAP